MRRPGWSLPLSLSYPGLQIPDLGLWLGSVSNSIPIPIDIDIVFHSYGGPYFFGNSFQRLSSSSGLISRADGRPDKSKRH